MPKRTVSFWKRFATDHWEKKPASFRSTVTPELVDLGFDAEEVFDLLIQYCERVRETGITDGLKFYIRGQPVYYSKLLTNLPLRTDRSFNGYDARMRKKYDDYCLVCDELLQVSHKSWEKLAAMAHQLYKAVGFPTRFSEIGLYVGNYRKTPFGVHVDGCGVFSWPIVGRKKFRLWSQDFVETNPALKEAFQYDEFKSGSTILEAKSGDMTYWPSSYWHIAESDGSFQATWSLGIWVDNPLGNVATEVLRKPIVAKLGRLATRTSIPFAKLYNRSGQVEQMPEALQKTVKAILELASDEETLQSAFLEYWLKLLSKRGFKTAPHRSTQSEKLRPLKDTDVVYGSASLPVLWAKINTRTIGIALSGRLYKVPHQPEIIDLLQKVNSGTHFQLGLSISDMQTSTRSRQQKDSRMAWKIIKLLYREQVLRRE